MPKLKIVFLISVYLFVVACSSQNTKDVDVFDSIRTVLKTASAKAGNEEYIHALYDSRNWMTEEKLSEDPLQFGKEAKIPILNEGIKILSPSDDDALRSLALKIWLIENAQHTIDMVYYIYTPDLAGNAVLGALCNAVKRGVDVRIMVDSVGSMSPFHTELMALETCADKADYMRTVDGKKTIYKARVQAVVFNALTSFSSRSNRRSHDKLLVVDGAFPNKAVVITGGRNMSLSYYGIKEDGSANHKVYRDLEIILKPGEKDSSANYTVGDVTTIYYTLLFLHNGNQPLQPVYTSNEYDIVKTDPYEHVRISAQRSLQQLKNLPEINAHLKDMSNYMETGFHDGDVKLAHELGNLTDTDVVTDFSSNSSENSNSIIATGTQIYGANSKNSTGSFKLVSPYVFFVRYVDDEGKVIRDGIAADKKWLLKNPNNRIEIITNSVLTSDNFMAQAVIDMNLAPRLLLTPKLQKIWLSELEDGEFNPDIVKSDEWKKLMNNPQIFIYEMGRLDSAKLGKGTKHYGKLHAKFVIGEHISFVGTSNFDYRSRLYNNEMGFFLKNDTVNKELDSVFQALKASSYRWGTPEWLQMRKQVMEMGGIKGWTTRHQRFIYEFLMSTGLIWLI